MLLGGTIVGTYSGVIEWDVNTTSSSTYISKDFVPDDELFEDDSDEEEENEDVVIT